MSTTECASCGRDTLRRDLTLVRRAYFFDAEDPDPEISEDEELWCGSCCHTYPHLEVGS